MKGFLILDITQLFCFWLDFLKLSAKSLAALSLTELEEKEEGGTWEGLFSPGF